MKRIFLLMLVSAIIFSACTVAEGEMRKIRRQSLNAEPPKKVTVYDESSKMIDVPGHSDEDVANLAYLKSKESQFFQSEFTPSIYTYTNSAGEGSAFGVRWSYNQDYVSGVKVMDELHESYADDLNIVSHGVEGYVDTLKVKTHGEEGYIEKFGAVTHGTEGYTYIFGF